jgi:tetratricopeptide (TPR) repeat protein
MSTPENTAYQEALAAIQNGEKSRARDLLTRLIKTNPNNYEYWLWMSAVVESSRELTFCLKETLKRDPQNITARRGLIMQGELPPDPSLAIPAHLQRRNWETQYFAGQVVPGQLPKTSGLRLALTIGGVLVLVVVAVIAILGFNRQEVPGWMAWLQRYTPAPTSNATAVPTLTLAPTATPYRTTGTPAFTIVTSVPTVLYVNTPHPITESYRSAINAYKRGDWVATLSFLQQAIKEDAKPDLYYLVGEANRMLNKTKEALAAYEQAIQMDPRFAPSYLGRARLRLAVTPSLSDAIRTDLEKATSLDNNYFEAYLELAAFKIDRQDTNSALLDLDTAARLQPTSPAPDILRVQAYIALNQMDQALIAARRANQLDPNSPEGYRLLAEVDRAKDDLLGSIQPLEIYTRYAVDDAEALAWLGQAYAAQGDLPAAERTLDKAIAIDPQSFEAHLRRGFVNIDLKDAKSAKDELNKANSIRPNSFLVYLGLGQVALLNTDSSEAWRSFSSALTLAQKNTEKGQAYYWRAMALEAGKQNSAALSDWNDCLNLPSDALTASQHDTAVQHQQNLIASATPPTRTPATSSTPSTTSTRTLTASTTSTRTPTATATATPSPTPVISMTATP